MILDQGAVKAFGTYDELRRSGVDIDDFVVRATEEELAEEMNNAAQIVEKNPIDQHIERAADGKSFHARNTDYCIIIFCSLSSHSLSLCLSLPSLSIYVSFFSNSSRSETFIIFVFLFLSHCLSHFHSLFLSLGSLFTVIPNAEKAVTGNLNGHNLSIL